MRATDRRRDTSLRIDAGTPGRLPKGSGPSSTSRWCATASRDVGRDSRPGL